MTLNYNIFINAKRAYPQFKGCALLLSYKQLYDTTSNIGVKNYP